MYVNSWINCSYLHDRQNYKTNTNLLKIKITVLNNLDFVPTEIALAIIR